MSLDRLLYELTVHYRGRGFPESALVHLRWTLVTNVRDGKLCLQTAYLSCTKSIADLIGRFPPCSQILGDPSSADAVFGFAFGYRMKAWSDGLAPTDTEEVRANRVPGPNNAALAEQARRLHLEYGLDLYLQFEIADAIGSGARVAYTSSRIDQGTILVARELLSQARQSRETIKTIVVVAHRHHFDRCRIVLEKEGIKCLPTPEEYVGYDPLEAVVRVMSPQECIVNDFASMAGML
jgi:hypothetical protein